MSYHPINFENKFARLPEQWSPRVIAEMNDYQFKVVKLQVTLYGTITKTPTRPLS